MSKKPTQNFQCFTVKARKPSTPEAQKEFKKLPDVLLVTPFDVTRYEFPGNKSEPILYVPCGGYTDPNVLRYLAYARQIGTPIAYNFRQLELILKTYLQKTQKKTQKGGKRNVR